MKQYLPYALYALIVIALIAGIIFAFNSKDSEPRGQNKPGASQQEAKNNGGKSNDTANKPESGNNDRPAGSVAERPQPTYTAPSSNNGGTQAPSANNTPAAQAPASGQRLANSGPEHVALLFVLATLGGAAFFSAYQRRGLSI